MIDPNKEQIACAIIMTLKRAEIPIRLKHMKNHVTGIPIQPDLVYDALSLLVEMDYISQNIDGSIQLTELGKTTSVINAYYAMI